jgi:hypothetical protein
MYERRLRRNLVKEEIRFLIDANKVSQYMPSYETISDGTQYFRAGVDVNRFQYTGKSQWFS